MNTFGKDNPVIEALYVDLNKVIIKLVNQDILILLILSSTDWGRPITSLG
jgi:hypothetical protein